MRALAPASARERSSDPIDYVHYSEQTHKVQPGSIWAMPTAKKILKAFGEVIAEVRAARKLSQDEVANRAGIARHYLSQIENGGRSPGIGVVVKIAGALSLSCAELGSRLDQKL